MHSALEFLLHHGYVVLLAWVFAEQIGLPVPSLPILLAAGALAGTGRFSFAGSIALSVFASLLADSMWYGLGRVRGIKVLQLLCKISLEPDSCVRRTQGVCAHHGRGTEAEDRCQRRSRYRGLAAFRGIRGRPAYDSRRFPYGCQRFGREG